jgi:hypothetical protein
MSRHPVHKFAVLLIMLVIESAHPEISADNLQPRRAGTGGAPCDQGQ